MRAERRRRAQWTALVAALLAHLGLAALFRVAADRRPASTSGLAPSAAVDPDVELDLEDGHETNRAADEPDDRHGERSARAGSSRRAASVGAASTAEERASTSPPSIAHAREAGEAWSLEMRRPDIGLVTPRYGRSASSAAPGEATGERPDDATAVTRAVLQGVEDHDRAAGLGYGGALAHALEDAARDADAPSLGVASFDVTVTSDGDIDVLLVDSHDEHDGWSRVGVRARAALARVALHRPSDRGGRGVRVRVRVEAIETFPDGRQPKELGTHLRATLGRIVETKDRITVEEVPNIQLQHAGKVCQVGIGVGLGGVIFGGNCDPSNVGAVAARHVRTAIVSETRL